MKAEHIRALDGIGFDWGTKRADSASNWNERFEQLREYKLQFGHCIVPQQYSANPKLGRWVSRQRNTYKLYHEGKSSPMTAKRIRELESVGFEWGTKRPDWNEQFEQLRVFVAQLGHCLVSFKYPVNPKLGRWVSNQRSNYKVCQEGKPSAMTAERIRALESVGFKLE
jgi:hypothetical protein